MIFGEQLSELNCYSSFFATIDFVALTDFVLGQDLMALAVGKHLLPNSQMYANVEEYTTVAATTRSFETHQRHGDLQIILQGSECLEFCSAAYLGSPLPPPAHLALGGDYQFFNVNPNFIGQVVASAGNFVYFPPHMPHRPSLHLPNCSIGQPVRKMVVKIPFFFPQKK